MAATWVKVSTDIYVASAWINDAVAAIRKHLEKAGWTVYNMDYSVTGGIMAAGGYLAVWHPLEVMMGRPGASQDEAVKAMDAAITSTGYYSVAGALATRVTQVGAAAADLTTGLAESAQPGAPSSPLLTTAKWGFVAVAALAVLGLVIYAAPLVRQGMETAKGLKPGGGGSSS